LEDLILHSAPPDESGAVVNVTPASAGWEYVGFEVLRLEPGANVRRDTRATEVCLVPVGGRCRVSTDGQTWEVGERATPFDGPPHALYLPPGMDYSVEALTELELAVCSAPAAKGVEARLISPEDLEVEIRGSGNMEREIRPLLMTDAPAERLLVTEVLTPGGHWSSYPPHKHDTDDLPNETYLEETYYHRVAREGGFAVQRVYTDDRSLDATLVVGDGDVVLVPRGYHPVSAPPGYDLYYLNVMAGPVREWKFTNDPDHDWLL
jgi:5-deoxy-glucuronate isomerase